MFFELLTPQLTSTGYINQLHNIESFIARARGLVMRGLKPKTRLTSPQ
jgi:hypothetical protein